jgi:hypothetical protein
MNRKGNAMKSWTQRLFAAARVLALAVVLLVCMAQPAAAVAPMYISGVTGLVGVTLTYSGTISGTFTTVDAVGTYSIPVPMGWSGTVTPTLTNYTFTPSSRTYTNLAGDQAAQNFAPVTYTAPGTGSFNWSAVFGLVPAGVKLIIPNGVTIVMNDNVSLAADLEVQAGGSLDPNGFTLTATGDSNQTFTGSPLTLANLTLNKDATGNTVTIAGTLVVTGTLTLTQGTLISASDYVDVVIEPAGALTLSNDITVSGNWTHDGALGSFVTNNHKVTFDGTSGAPQTIGGGTQSEFYDLVIAAGADVILATLPYAGHSVENYGKLSETKYLDSFESVDFLMISETLYQGVTISSLGNFNASMVTVTVWGNAAHCTTNALVIHRNRCFRITFNGAGDVNLTFYTTVAEDGINNDAVFQYVISGANAPASQGVRSPSAAGNWVQIGTPPTLCDTTPGQPCDANGVFFIPSTNFFLIGDTTAPPTAVTLRGFAAQPAAGLPAVLFGGLALLGAGALLRRRAR